MWYVGIFLKYLDLILIFRGNEMGLQLQFM